MNRILYGTENEIPSEKQSILFRPVQAELISAQEDSFRGTAWDTVQCC